MSTTKRKERQETKGVDTEHVPPILLLLCTIRTYVVAKGEKTLKERQLDFLPRFWHTLRQTSTGQQHSQESQLVSSQLFFFLDLGSSLLVPSSTLGFLIGYVVMFISISFFISFLSLIPFQLAVFLFRLFLSSCTGSSDIPKFIK